MSKTRKPYSKMNARELAAATARFDREMPGLPGRPLKAAQKKVHRNAAHAAKKKTGRPMTGQGAQTVAVSIERGLLRKADALGKRRKLGRSALFAAALQTLLAGQIKTKAG